MSNNPSGKQIRLVTVCGLSLVLMACGGGGSPPPPPVVTITISPTSASVLAGGTQQFTASVTGSSNTTVTWSVNTVAGGNSVVGTINNGGLYVAPSNLESTFRVTVTATSQADSTKSSSATVTLNPNSGNLSSLNPIVTVQNSPAFTLTVNGTGFDSSSRMVFNGALKTPTSQTPTQLMAQISTSDIASAGTFPVTVQTGGQPVGTLHFFVVPPIQPRSVPVTAGGMASVNIDIPVPPSPPSLSFIAAGLCGLTVCTAGATGTQVGQGTSVTLFLVGNGFVSGTFFKVTAGNSSDVTVTQPLASGFGPTTNGLASERVTVSVAPNAQIGPRNIIVTNPAGEISVFPGGLLITQ